MKEQGIMPFQLTEQQWHMLMNDDRILAEIREECARQLAQWKGEDHSPVVWLGLITEQVGQAASAILSNHPRSEAETQRQLVHIAALCVSAIEDLRMRAVRQPMANGTDFEKR
jgi:hypothetical protein